MCSDCTKQIELVYKQKTVLHLQSLARGLLSLQVANISGGVGVRVGDVVSHCPDHSSSPSLLSILYISFDSYVGCATLCLFSNIKLRAKCYMAKGYV